MTSSQLFFTLIDFILLVAIIVATLKEDKLIEFENKIKEVIRKR